MISLFQNWIDQLQCKHDYKYSRTKPGTLVCKKCRARKGKPG